MNQLNMSKLLMAIKSGAVDFGRDEEGAQIVEYGLIIAVVSIALVIACRRSPVAADRSGHSSRVLRAA